VLRLAQRARVPTAAAALTYQPRLHTAAAADQAGLIRQMGPRRARQGQAAAMVQAAVPSSRSTQTPVAKHLGPELGD